VQALGVFRACRELVRLHCNSTHILRSAFCQAQFAKRQSSAFSFKRILPSAFCLCSEHVVSSSGCTATPQAHFSGSHAHFHSSAFSFHSVHSIQPITFCVLQFSACSVKRILPSGSQVQFAKQQSCPFSVKCILPSGSQAHFHSIQFIQFSQARFVFIQFSAYSVKRILPSGSQVQFAKQQSCPFSVKCILPSGSQAHFQFSSFQFSRARFAFIQFSACPVKRISIQFSSFISAKRVLRSFNSAQVQSIAFRQAPVLSV